MGTILKATNLMKDYSGKSALCGMNLEIETGKIYGLLGPNGSGKTTFMKIAAGILQPSSGEILIDNNKPGKYTKSIVSYLSDKDYLYKWMKIRDAVDYYSDFYDDFDSKKMSELLDFMNLNMDSKVTSLSKGMMEKLTLSLVMARKAKLYILDEPLGGVDPTTREKIIDTIINNFSQDSAMIISTHQVYVIERLFDDAIFLRDGQIELMGNAEDLRNEHKESLDELFREVFR